MASRPVAAVTANPPSQRSNEAESAWARAAGAGCEAVSCRRYRAMRCPSRLGNPAAGAPTSGPAGPRPVWSGSWPSAARSAPVSPITSMAYRSAASSRRRRSAARNTSTAADRATANPSDEL